MNKNNHQLIFNAARGCIMAVAETSSRCGKGGGASVATGTGSPTTASRTVAILTLALSALSAALVQAQIVADPTAPANQRPAVLNTPNGAPLVNIQTPSAAGVSRNTYKQFDVNSSGAVLNNSRQNRQTQLGGWVQGNPWLARGEARVIVNQVNSANPSQLKGFIEIAGQRAEVIIANPAGIQVDGAGFINASRATLTTGTPQFNNGSLESYRVQRGTVRIEGAGLNASLTDYTGILARAIELNAAVHAKDLRLVTGDNTISSDQTQLQVSASASDGGSPAFALDVSQLGGMYVGKITLVGTEAGVGVRHHGTLSASSGDVAISSSGWLSSAGAIEAKQGNVSVSTALDQSLSGSMTAAGNLSLQAGTQDQPQAITNSGNLRAGLEAHIRVSDLSNSGGIDAQRLDVAVTNLNNSGAIWQSGSQALQVQAQSLRNANGAAIGAVQSATTSPAPAPSPSPAPSPAPAPAPSTGSAPTPPSAPAPAPLAEGIVSVSGELLNQSPATLAAAGELNIQTSRSLSNAGHLRANSVQAQGASFAVSAGTVQADTLAVNTQAVNLNGGAVVAGIATISSTTYTQAQGAQLYSQGELVIVAQSLSNSGEIQSGASARLSVAETLSHTGTLAAADDLRITAGSVNSSGTLAAGLKSDGSLKAFAVDGAQLHVATTGDLSANGKNLAAGALSLNGAGINLGNSQTSAHSAALTASAAANTDNAKVITVAGITLEAQSLSNTAGTIYAGGSTTLALAQAMTSTGTLAAAGDLNITAGSVNSIGTLAAGLNPDGSLKSFAVDGAQLRVTTTDDLIATGKNLTAGALNFRGAAVNLSNSQTSAFSADLSARAELSSRGAQVITQQALALDAQGLLDNTQGTLASKAGPVSITAQGVNNTQGLVVAASTLSVNAGSADITNTQGQLLAQGDLSLGTVANVTNTEGLIQSNAALAVNAATLNNSQTAAETQGIVGQDVTLGVASLSNNLGQVLAGRDLSVNARIAIDNTQGKLNAQRALTLQDSAPSAATQPGTRQLAITNTGGQIVANQITTPTQSSVTVRAKTLGLDGTVSSGGDMSLDLVGDLNTATAQNVRAGRNLSVQLHGGTFDNAGQWQARTNLSVRADNINNQATGELLSQGTTLLDTTQNAQGSLTNRGLIDGADTHINSHTVDNVGSGRIYGDRIVIAANTLSNRAQTLNGTTHAATIAARERLDIGAQHITNQDGALIFSAGDMAIGGALGANGQAITDGTANAKTLNNSATLESLGNMALAADVLRNTNEPFRAELAIISGPTDMTLIQPSGETSKIASTNLVWEDWERAGQYRYDTTPDPFSGAPAELGKTPIPEVGQVSCVNPEDDATCTRVPGADYPVSDPAWAYFKVTTPEAEPAKPTVVQPVKPSLSEPVAPNAAGASACESAAGFNAQACAAHTKAQTQYNTDKAAYDQAWNAYNTDQSSYDAAWATYQTVYDKWLAETDARYNTLDGAIEAYNQQFTAKIIRVWTQYNIKRTIRESQVVASDPGNILTGGSLTLRGQDLLNDKSRIVVGQTLQGDADKLVNKQATGQNVLNDQGTTFVSNIVRKRSGLFGKKRWRRENTGEEAYTPPDVITGITLPVTELQQNTAPTGTGTQLAAKAATGAIGSAGVGISGTAPGTLSGSSAATSVASAGQASNKAPASQGASATAGLGQQTAPGPVLPNSSLFKIDPRSNASYLVETDPRFANFRQWLSSDYLLTASGYQPETTQKRLGDGFYEQKLIRDQVAALTGYRFLGDYRSDEAQYMALMTAGATFARAQQLRPGIALSPAQVAQLTSDVVWLVTQTVRLPDGSTTTALVPQVYLAPKSGDLAANGRLLGGPKSTAAQGSLISAQDIQLAFSGDLSNSGTIAGRKLIDISAQNINNSGLIQADTAQLKAKEDINITGGQVAAISKLEATAGGDLNVSTTTQSGATQAGANRFSQTGIDRVAGLYVSGPAGVLLASAGNNINLTAAQIINQGSGTTQLSAGNTLNLNTLQTGQSQDITWNANNYLRQSSSQEVGSQVSGGGAVNINAQNNITLRAADVNAQGALSVSAKQGSVTIEAGQSEASLAEARQVKSRSTFSSTTTTTRSANESTTAQASDLGGQSVTITSGADTRITGSNVIADKDLSINAKGDVTIDAAQNTQGSSAFNETRKSGLMGSGGIGISIGTQQQSLDQQGQSTTAAASTVGSTGGNVTITAGNTFTQTGSDVLTPVGNIDITAKSVNINEARETGSQSTDQRFKQSGLTLAITSPVISALQTANSQIQAAGNTSSTRMQALAGANAAMNLKQGADAIQAGQGQVPTGNKTPDGTPEMVEGNAADKAGGVGISISLGSSSSRSNQSSTANTARGSQVIAGGSISIQATGAGKDSDLTLQGSTVQAGGKTTLKADDAVSILAAVNTTSESNSSSSKSGSIGVGIQLGAGGANMGVTASASRGTGQGAGNGTTYTNSQVAGSSVQIDSGGDTTLKGAVVTATQVTATVGGNLSIESLQDSNRYNERNQSAGGSVTIGPAPGGSINLAKSSINSNFNSVGEQSAIRAGDGGFAVNVAGNTALTGGQITSTQAAIDQGKNAFTTGGTLTTTDLQNQASFEAKSVSIGVGTSGGKVAPSGVGIGSDKGSASSTTAAAISGIAGNTAARTGDKETGIGQIFDKDKVQKEVAAQVAITSEFGKQASKAVGDYAGAKLREAEKNNDQAGIEAWKEGGANRVALHAVVGGLTGGTQGALGAASSQLAIDQVGQALKDTSLPAELKQALVLAAGTALGAATGSTSGAATAFNATNNNYLLHNKLKDEEGELLRLRKQKESGQCDINCETRVKELEALDKIRDEQLAPLIAACEKAGRNNCKGEAIAQNFAQANGFGSEAMKRESNAGTQGSPFSFNNCPSSDKGGCSYGPLQIAADTGMMSGFIEELRKNPSDEAQSFYKELQAAGGVNASQNKDPTFIKTWMKLTAKDPQFVQYQIDALVNQNLYAVVQELQKVGIDFNTLTSSQKEALFSASVQHGAGTVSKTKGADNVLERAISIAQTDTKAPSFPTYTRQELVYGQVEDQMRSAEESKAKLITQREILITQREILITQREILITQQLSLERQKSQLLEQGLGANSGDVQRVQAKVKALDERINVITNQVAPISARVTGLTNQVGAQDKNIQEAAQYLKSQAQGSLADGEQWLKDFYQQRTQMYPAEAKRYQAELESLLKQYHAEKKAKGK